MKTLLQQFGHLWPAASQEGELKRLLARIRFYIMPTDQARLSQEPAPHECVLIFEKGSPLEIISAINLGFKHCVQSSRPDFAQELLAAALMIAKPQAFRSNPMPFFFRNFSPDKKTASDLAFVKALDRSTMIESALTELDEFLSQSPRGRRIKDLCLQTGDEMLTNAFFNAPVNGKGQRLFQHLVRATDVLLPPAGVVVIFACCSNERVIIGCEDSYGSLERKPFLEHLNQLFVGPKAEPRPTKAGPGGARIGFRFIVENAANFYLDVQPGRRTLVAAGFLTAGLKANLESPKHFHAEI